MTATRFGCVFAALNVPLALFALSLFAVGFVPPDTTLNLFLANEGQAIALRNLSINWRDEIVVHDVWAVSLTSIAIGGIYAVFSIVPIAFCCYLANLRIFLGFYVAFIGLLLLALVALTFFLGAGQQWVFSMLRTTLRSGYESSSATHDSMAMLWNTIQVILQCCGYDGGLDYGNKIMATLAIEGSQRLLPKNKTMTMLIPPSCCTVPALTEPIIPVRKTNTYHPLVQCVFYASSFYSNFQTGCADKIWPFAMTMFGITMASCWYLLFLLAMATHALTDESMRISSDNYEQEGRHRRDNNRRPTTIGGETTSGGETQRLTEDNAQRA